MYNFYNAIVDIIHINIAINKLQIFLSCQNYIYLRNNTSKIMVDISFGLSAISTPLL